MKYEQADLEDLAKAAVKAARVQLTYAAKQVQAEAAQAAQAVGLQVVTLCWDAEGAFRLNYPPTVNINVLVGLLSRAVAAAAEPGRYADDGSLAKGPE